MKRSLNWTERKRVSRKDIDAELLWIDDSLSPTLKVKINLENYEFDFQGRILLEAYRRETLSFMDFDLGEIKTEIGPLNLELKDFSREDLPNIRIVIVDEEEQYGKIAGRSSGFVPKNSEDKIRKETEFNLLHIQETDLGERIYDIDYPDSPEDYPTIRLNNTIPQPKSLMTLGKPWGRALILSDAIREILTQILIHENETYNDAGKDWKSIWLRSFSQNILGEAPPDNSTDGLGSSETSVNFERRYWIEKATDKFCSKNNLKIELVNFIEMGRFYQ
ncbi:MAG: hypothetical protein ACJZ2J_01130 [Candidatus Poseidoniales archaeon]